jgi:hypothetical protein
MHVADWMVHITSRTDRFTGTNEGQKRAAKDKHIGGLNNELRTFIVR